MFQRKTPIHRYDRWASLPRNTQPRPTQTTPPGVALLIVYHEVCQQLFQDLTARQVKPAIDPLTVLRAHTVLEEKTSEIPDLSWTHTTLNRIITTLSCNGLRTLRMTLVKAAPFSICSIPIQRRKTVLLRHLQASLIFVWVMTLSPWHCALAAQGNDPEQPKESEAPKRDVIYVPTPQENVNLMLKLANIKQSDLLYDLGCGDGRIVVTAARDYGCRAKGFDIDPVRVSESLANVKEAHVEDLVAIEQKNIFDLDLSQADVVTLYLLPELNVRLIPQLEMMKPGSRIVSHDFDMKGVEPDMVLTIGNLAIDGHMVYVWTVPLKKTVPPAPKPDGRGPRPGRFSRALAYVSHSVPCFVAMAAAALAVFFKLLYKRLGVIVINVAIGKNPEGRPR